MLIKRGKVEIIDVVKDTEHDIDDLGTKEALDKTKQDLSKKGTENKKESLEN